MQAILDRMPCVPATDVENIDTPSSGLLLAQNYPNPVTAKSAATAIDFVLPGTTQLHATLSVYDALGRRVASLVDAALAPGKHSVSLNATALSAGVYTIRLSAGGSESVRSMTVVK